MKFLSKRYRGILCAAVAGGILSVLAGCGDTATPTIVSQSVPTAAPSQEPLATMAVDTTSESTPSMRSTKVHATSESTIRYILQSSVEPFYSFGEITLGPLPGPDGSYFAGTVVTLTASPSDRRSCNSYPYWSFPTWFGDFQSSEPRIEITMDSDKTVNAGFTEFFPPPC